MKLYFRKNGVTKRLHTVTSEVSGGGHTIVDKNGNTMTARTNLQFTGTNVTDDSTNDKTVVAIPTTLSAFTNDENFIKSTVDNLTNYYLKTETYTKSEVNSLISGIVTLNILVVQTLPTTDISQTTIYLVPKTTAETQDVYDEYINIDGTSQGWEHIGSTQVDLSNYYTKSETDTLLNGKVSDNPTFTEASARANIASGESFATILGKIKKFFTDLKAVAFSGSYNDLSNKPTIPTVNNGTLTIQKNGSNVQTFSANQSGNATANITVPTKTSELTNNSNFITSSHSSTNLTYEDGNVGKKLKFNIGTTNAVNIAVSEPTCNIRFAYDTSLGKIGVYMNGAWKGWMTLS